MTKPTNIYCKDREEIFYKYLSVVNGLLPPSSRLTQRETEIMAYTCTQNPDQDQFQGTNMVRMEQRFTKMTRMHLAQIKASLKKKGWIVNGRITNRIRPQLQKFYASKDNPFIEINLNLNFTDKTVDQFLHE